MQASTADSNSIFSVFSIRVLVIT